MGRTLTAILTGLWVGPLLGVATTALVLWLPTPRGGTDQGMAQGLLGLLAGILVGFAGLLSTFWVVRMRASESHLATLRVLDGVVFVVAALGGLALYLRFAERPAPGYEGFQAVLDVEVRVPRTLLGGADIQDAIAVFFGNGEASASVYPERARREGDDVILPVEFVVLRLHDWSVAVRFRGERYWFQLDMPERPAGNVPWSNWQACVPRRDWDRTSSIVVRSRWVLTPLGQSRVWQP